MLNKLKPDVGLDNLNSLIKELTIEKLMLLGIRSEMIKYIESYTESIISPILEMNSATISYIKVTAPEFYSQLVEEGQIPTSMLGIRYLFNSSKRYQDLKLLKSQFKSYLMDNNLTIRAVLDKIKKVDSDLKLIDQSCSKFESHKATIIRNKSASISYAAANLKYNPEFKQMLESQQLKNRTLAKRISVDTSPGLFNDISFNQLFYYFALDSIMSDCRSYELVNSTVGLSDDASVLDIRSAIDSYKESMPSLESGSGSVTSLFDSKEILGDDSPDANDTSSSNDSYGRDDSLGQFS